MFQLRTLSLTLVVSVSFAGVNAHAWEKEAEDEGIIVYSQETSYSDIDTFKAVTTFAYTTDKVHRVLSDIPNFKNFMPDLEHAKLLKKEQLRDGRIISHIYQRLGFNTLSDRDMVVEAVTMQRKRDAGTEYTSTFSATDKVGPGAKNGTIRIGTLSGVWHLKPTSDGKTKVTYIRHIEMGGSIPDWMVNSGCEDSMMDTLKNLRTYLGKVR